MGSINNLINKIENMKLEDLTEKLKEYDIEFVEVEDIDTECQKCCYVNCCMNGDEKFSYHCDNQEELNCYNCKQRGINF